MSAIRVLEYAEIAWNNIWLFVSDGITKRTKLRMIEKEVNKILDKS